ncbi:MAG: AsmA-like C-terminal region-containing protein [Bacteroidota bacterium]
MKTFKRIIKWFFIIVLLLIAMVIAAPFVFKGKLIEMAKEEINNNVKAKVDFGEFDLSLFSTFPNMKFVINNVTVIGVDEFEGDTLANLKQFRTQVGLWSVMSDKIKIRSIVIENPVIMAKVLPGGLANWDIAVESEDSTATDTTAEEETNYKLALKEFKIIDGQIIYDDKDMDVYAEIKNLNFDLNGDLAMDVTSLNTNTSIEEISVIMEGISYLKKAKMELKADIEADLENFKFTFKENLFRLNELELGFDGYVAMPDTNIDIDMTFDAKKTEFKNILSLVPAVYLNDFNTVQTSGKLALNGFAKGTYNASQLPAFDLTLLVENAMFKYPDLPGSANNIQIDLNVKNPDGIEDNTIVNLKKFHIDFAGNPFDMKMLVTTPVSDPNINGEVKGTIDLEKIKQIVPLEDMTISGIITSDIEMKGKLSSIENEQYEEFHAIGTLLLQNMEYKSVDFPQGVKIAESSLTVSPQYFELATFTAILGKSDIQMNGKIENFLAYYFRDEMLNGTFNLKSNTLDLNELMGESEETSAETTETAVEEDMTVMEVPKNIDFGLSTTVNNLFYDNLIIKNVIGAVMVKEGIVYMDNLSLDMLDGNLLLGGNYSTADITKPSVDFVMIMKGFDIRKTFDAFNTVQKIAPIAEDCSGNFSMNLNFNGILQPNMEPDLASVNGNGRFQTKNVVVDNTDIFNQIGDLMKTDKFKTLNLTDVNFTFKIENGNISVDPFESKFSKSVAVFGGKQGIDQSLAYNINFKVPSSEFGSAANQVVNNLFTQVGQTGINVSMPEVIDFNAKIGGTVLDPKVTLDLKEQANNVVEDIKDQVIDKVNEEIDKAKAEAIRKAEEQAAKLLAEADKKGKELIAAAEKSATEIKKNAKTSADKVRSEANAQADKLIKEAGSNPIKKKVAEESAKKIRSEAEKQASNIESEASKQANNGVNAAKNEATNLNKNAKAEGDKLIEKARNS